MQTCTFSLCTAQGVPMMSSTRVFPKWSRTFIEFSKFRESDKSLKHPVSHMCLACAMVVSWSQAGEEAGSRPFIVMQTNIFLSLNSSSVKHLEKTPLPYRTMHKQWGSWYIYRTVNSISRMSSHNFIIRIGDTFIIPLTCKDALKCLQNKG